MYTNEKEMKELQSRLKILDYSWCVRALEGDEEARTAHEAMVDLVKEIDVDVKYGSCWSRHAYVTIMAMFDSIKSDRDDSGAYNIPYDIVYAINAIANCV